MRAERLLKIIRTLQSKGKQTTKQLAELVEVSERTILRDMDALTLAGIPVVADRGKSGGWKLMEHFQQGFDDVQLDVLKALFIIPSEHILTALNIEGNGTTVRESLLAKLPAAVKHDAQQYFAKIYIDTSTWKGAHAAPVLLKEIQLALWEERKLSISYQKASGECSERVVCPLGLVAKGNSWYVVALNEQGEYRNFKVSRIRHVEIEDETFSRPPSFQLSRYWEQSKSQFVKELPVVEVSVLAHRSILPRLSFSGKFISKIEVMDGTESGSAGEAASGDTDAAMSAPTLKSSVSFTDTMVQVRLQFNSEQEAVECVLGFGAMMRLLQPVHLIPEIIKQAKAVIDQYERHE